MRGFIPTAIITAMAVVPTQGRRASNMAKATPIRKRNDTAPPAFFLAGDSTTAVDGGWGNGFLATLTEPAFGVNIGKSGATTKSFRDGGYWENITDHVSQYAESNDVYVTISFGHNDQKEDSGVTDDEFLENLKVFGNEILALGGTPLYVTSLTRRTFSDGTSADDSLHDQRLMAIEAADSLGAPVADLNEQSLWYVNQIGEEEAHKFNLASDDNTHLNPWGETVFGRMVSDLALDALPGILDAYTEPNATLSDALAAGVPPP